MTESKVARPLPRYAIAIFGVGILLIVLRLALWHVIFDQTDERDRKFIEGREAVTGMHCANDRSRWATVASLIHFGTFSIDDVDSRRGKDGNWGTIDKVYHMDRDGVERFFSSKPPLYNVLLAAQYWAFNKLSGVSMLERPIVAIKFLTFLNQSVLLLIIWIGLAKFGNTVISDRRLFSLFLITITFGTFLTSFAVTLNNHLPAALFVLLAVQQCYALTKDSNQPLRFALIGFCCAMTVTFELPALAFLCLTGLWCLALDFKKTIVFGLPAILLVAVAYFGVNKIAHDSWRPPYAHRSDGEVLEVISLDDGDSLVAGILPENLGILSETMPGMGNYRIEDHPTPGRWRLFDYQNNARYALVRRDSTYEIREWDNWYDYEVNGRKSYWLPGQAAGVDRGEKSKTAYLMHLIIGHHGLLSLTPVWLFAFVAMVRHCWHGDSFWRPLARITLLLTFVLLAFYVMRPLQDRNYGGVAIGFRWMFWLIPLYSLFLAQAVRNLKGSFLSITIFLVATVISIYSVHYGFLTPWQNPWPFSY